MSEITACLTEAELAKRHQRSVRTLQAERLRGGGIPYLKIGRSVRYRIVDVVAWEDAHLVLSTSDAEKLKGAGHGR